MVCNLTNKKYLAMIFIIMICYIFFVTNVNATEPPTGVSIESLQRVQAGMTRQEVNDIIGHDSDVMVSPSMISFRNGINVTRTRSTWSDGGPFPLGSTSMDNARITVLFVNGLVYSIMPSNIPDASQYHFHVSYMAVLNTSLPPPPRTPFIESVVFFPVLVLSVLFVTVCIPYLYNQSKPLLVRNASIVSKRFGGWGRNTRFYISFKLLETDKIIEFRLPWNDRLTYATTSIGDIGVLSSRGSRLEGFRTPRRRD